MSQLRQEFSKWLQKASDEEKARAPYIEEVLRSAPRNPKRHDGAPDRAGSTGGNVGRDKASLARNDRRSDRKKRNAGRKKNAGHSVKGYQKRERTGKGKSTKPPRVSEPPELVFRLIPVTRHIIKAAPPATGGANGAGAIPTRHARARRERSHADASDARPLADHEKIPLIDEVSHTDALVASQLGADSGERMLSPSKSMANASAGPIRRSREKIRVQVGLDFGTSTTKVMYQQLGVPERRIRPFHLHSGLEDYPSFALPSLAVFDRAGHLFLGDAAARRIGHAAWHSGLSRFKMLMAGRQDRRFLDRREHGRYQEHVKRATGNENNCPPEILSAVYLAFVMRRIRLGLTKSLGATDIDLAFNICVPVDQRENSAVMIAFGRAVAVAQELDRSGDPLAPARAWVDRASILWNELSYCEEDPSNRAFVVPESVASTAAYVTSLRRTPGLHALIDIGAGTTEVSIFNLSVPRRQDPTSYWYAARSIPRGAGYVEGLVARRVSLDPNALASYAVLLGHLNGTKGSAEVRRLIEEGLMDIWRPSRTAWGEAYGHLKRESRWTRDAVRVFLAGGGALIPEARSVFAASWMHDWGPYPCEILSEPDGVDRSRLGAPFARLCVAYGLSIPIPELGRNVLPADAPNHTPPPPAIRDWSRDGDQLIPRYGWT